MRKYRSYNEEWNGKIKNVEIHSKCLALTIANVGKDNVVVDGVDILLPGQSMSMPVVPGYYLTGALKLEYADPTNLVGPRVIIRQAIDVTEE